MFPYHAVLLLHELPVHDVRGRRIHGEHRVAVILDDIVVIAGAGHTLRHLALQLTSLGASAFGFREESPGFECSNKSQDEEEKGRRLSLGERELASRRERKRPFNATTDNNSALSLKYVSVRTPLPITRFAPHVPARIRRLSARQRDRGTI